MLLTRARRGFAVRGRVIIMYHSPKCGVMTVAAVSRKADILRERLLHALSASSLYCEQARSRTLSINIISGVASRGAVAHQLPGRYCNELCAAAAAERRRMPQIAFSFQLYRRHCAPSIRKIAQRKTNAKCVRRPTRPGGRASTISRTNGYKEDCARRNSNASSSYSIMADEKL